MTLDNDTADRYFGAILDIYTNAIAAGHVAEIGMAATRAFGYLLAVLPPERLPIVFGELSRDARAFRHEMLTDPPTTH